MDDLVDWCEFIETYLHDRILSTHTLDDPEYFEKSYGEKVAILRRAREEQNLRGMRVVFRDENEMARGVGGALRRDLDRALRERFGRGLERGDRHLARQARAMLNRGKISTADQYRILETRLGALIDDEAGSDEVAQINARLATVKEPLPD
ncbi:MAG: hypothetical protein U1E67_21570 [Hyphomicrobiales bacterium]